jgi:serine/threonine-protein kinase
MHKGGFVHADVKPGNIMVMADGNVKIIDFGQSAPIHQAKPRIQGTPDYMAPEQANKQRLDARTDIFGLGAALYRILTGLAMTTDMNQNLDMGLLRVGMRRRDEEGASLDEYPPVLRKLIEDSCKADPAERPPDAKTFVERCRMARLIIAKRQEFNEAANAPKQEQDS